MTPLRTINLLRTLFVIFSCFIGSTVGAELLPSWWSGAAAGLTFGLLVVLADRLLKGITLRTFSSATFGLLLGVIFAQLLLASNVLKYGTEEARWVLSLMVYGTFGYFGMMLAVRSNRDEFSLVIPYIRFQQAAVQDMPLLIDSNIIIDGRIQRLCATGFVGCSLVVPQFVLDELQRLADSSDPLKRERGRRALDSLQEMQNHSGLHVTIHETALDPETPVDTKLIQLAQLLRARLLTNDANLCKIARLQNVTALNLNELASALRPVLSAGEELEVALVREGREPHQAVGYLPDGTMIVVNHARPNLGKNVRVIIGSTVQTAAGRLFFAELKKP